MKKGYTEEQLNFIEFSGPESIILSATAGSGKTHSTVGRLNHLLANGVDPNRIIFFSFTNDAVNELRNRIDNEVKITTIHSFTSSILGKLGKFKPIVTFYDFINWYRDKKKPSFKDPRKVREEYYKTIEKFYEEGASISSSFSAYKLQFYDGVRSPKPNYYDHYVAFLKDTNSRDFSDMLIDTEKLSKDPKHRDFFNGMYDYVFIDEYQDTSTLQMKILSSINAKQYYLIGDKNQSIYGFSGANCLKIEALLKQKKTAHYVRYQNPNTMGMWMKNSSIKNVCLR
jgi:DNA helicase-2/ATP-dependent DNA helicase PcrA